MAANITPLSSVRAALQEMVFTVVLRFCFLTCIVFLLYEDAASVKARAQALLDAVAQAIPKDAAQLSIVPETSRAGGGALPMCDIPTYAVRMEPRRGDVLDIARHLEQACNPPVIARIHDGALIFDARTLLDGEPELVAQFVAEIIKRDCPFL